MFFVEANNWILNVKYGEGNSRLVQTAGAIRKSISKGRQAQLNTVDDMKRFQLNV